MAKAKQKEKTQKQSLKDLERASKLVDSVDTIIADCGIEDDERLDNIRCELGSILEAIGEVIEMPNGGGEYDEDEEFDDFEG